MTASFSTRCTAQYAREYVEIGVKSEQYRVATCTEIGIEMLGLGSCRQDLFGVVGTHNWLISLQQHEAVPLSTTRSYKSPIMHAVFCLVSCGDQWQCQRGSTAR